ncbi:serine/threonine-protein kinase [Aquisphaera insulae]|uniref:serine/threonine-protein kinase n=1 Tax=Aquisphaera insulae TaxID=2712864 RepID=UPI0013E9FEFF|nr:serine/threonine-protein kinase [Aquisphaera insulae]
MEGSSPWQAWNLPAGDISLGNESAASTVLRGGGFALPFPTSDSAQPFGAGASPWDALAPPARAQSERSGRWDDPRRQSDRLPSIGDEIGGFRLVLEIGHGAFARVFLAEQINLAGRLVAVKISRAEGDEPRMLARLHHANIMPLHSVHDDQATGLRILCMPYFGGANLAQVLHFSWGLARPQASGRSLVEALDALGRRIPEGLRAEPSVSPRSRSRRSPRIRHDGPSGRPPRKALSRDPGVAGSNLSESLNGLRSLMSRLVQIREPRGAAGEDGEAFVPSRSFLRDADAVHAAVWIVARLAEGLDHAHSRGLLHRDLKPANILIAADGTPMLLDFNLAAEREPGTTDADRASRAAIGGTLPYMSPEHLDALDPAGSTPPESIDERSDIYSLGLILYEMIAGEHPFEEVLPEPGQDPMDVVRTMIENRSARPVPSLRRACPGVPSSLDALVGQCLDPDPDRRYQSAHDLAEDLRRFLENRPMRYCPEPSLKERMAKWARRHPVLSSSTSIAAASLAVMVLLGFLGWGAYDSMLGLSARMKLRAYERAAINCQFLLSLGAEEALTRRGLDQTREILAEVGLPDPGAEPPPTGTASTRATSAADPQVHLASWIDRLTPTEAARVRLRSAELLILEARAGVALASRETTGDGRRRALRRGVALLEQARRLGPNFASILHRDLARYRMALGQGDEGAKELKAAAVQDPDSPEDWTMLATSLLAEGDLHAAETSLRQALNQDVTSLWAWFALGHCYFEQGRYLEASGSFSACVALGPDHAIAHFNRGLALAKAGRMLEALGAYDQAVRLDASLVEARANRAFVELELDRPEAALADLRAAVQSGCRRPVVLAATGEALSRLGKQAEAQAWFSEMLEKDPGDAVARTARGMSRLIEDADGAMEDFSEVLARDPRNPLAHYGTARLVRGRDHRRAITHLNAAIEADPHLIDAIELRALERARLGMRSALDDVDRLVRAATPRRLYNAACALAVYGEKARDSASHDQAVEILNDAVAAGFPRSRAAEDPDLSALIDRPDFRRVVGLPDRTTTRREAPRS